MDDLAKFLPEANWRQRGQHTSICDDNNLEPILVKYVSELPRPSEALDSKPGEQWEP
jgi:hypothetical protein